MTNWGGVGWNGSQERNKTRECWSKTKILGQGLGVGKTNDEREGGVGGSQAWRAFSAFTPGSLEEVLTREEFGLFTFLRIKASSWGMVITIC